MRADVQNKKFTYPVLMCQESSSGEQVIVLFYSNDTGIQLHPPIEGINSAKRTFADITKYTPFEGKITLEN